MYSHRPHVIAAPLAAMRRWTRRLLAARQAAELRALERRVAAARLGLGSPA